MAGEWPSVSLGDLVEIQHGYAFAGGYFRDEPPGDVLVTPGNFRPGGGFQQGRSKYYAGPVPAAFVLNQGDLIITMTDLSRESDTLGFPARVPAADDHGRFLHNQRLGRVFVRPGVEVERDFLYYLLCTRQYRSEVLASATGTTVKHTSPSRIGRFRFELPPVAEQQRIARILGALDEKIELNRRTNETLEAIARAPFKSWFVDFDPVRAKSQGRDPGLPPHLADLFPDSFVDSELGEIPKGWRVSGLDEIATYLNGLALQKYPPDDSGSLPVIKIAQLRAGHTDGADRASADIPPAYVVEDGDVLFSWSGSLEVEIWCGGRGALNQHLFKVTSGRFPKWFYFLWTRHHLPGFRAIAAGKATTMGHIQRGHLSAARALVPPPRLVEAMSAHLEPLFEDLIAGRLQSHTLAALRDALLPKLIAGELRVSDVERSMGSMQ